jgi:hypothetical protein
MGAQLIVTAGRLCARRARARPPTVAEPLLLDPIDRG